MKNILITALHPGVDNIDALKDIMRYNPEQFDFNFVWEEDNPDYVFVSNIFYTDKHIYNKYLEYRAKGSVFIFFTGECLTPDLNLFDYAISFDRNLKCDDRITRLPMFRFFNYSLFDEFLNKEITPDILKEKTLFCNYMYSHQGHPIRERLFYEVSKYKRVDSLGKFLNNTGKKSTRYNADWRKLSIIDRESYKFSISAENGCCPGYVDEKFLSCLQARTVPIYWGDPTIVTEFNPRAFINTNDFSSWDELREKIKEIDQNDALFLEMLSEPWQTSEQKQYSNEQSEKYDSFITNIFAQEKSKAHRMPTGTYPDMYLNWLKKRYKKNLLNRIKWFIGNAYIHLKGKQ